MYSYKSVQSGSYNVLRSKIYISYDGNSLITT